MVRLAVLDRRVVRRVGVPLDGGEVTERVRKQSGWREKEKGQRKEREREST